MSNLLNKILNRKLLTSIRINLVLELIILKVIEMKLINFYVSKKRKITLKIMGL